MKINSELVYSNDAVYRFIAVAHSKHIITDIVFNRLEGIVIKIKATKKEIDNFWKKINHNNGK